MRAQPCPAASATSLQAARCRPSPGAPAIMCRREHTRGGLLQTVAGAHFCGEQLVSHLPCKLEVFAQPQPHHAVGIQRRGNAGGSAYDVRPDHAGNNHVDGAEYALSRCDGEHRAVTDG
eukprot:1640084-Prymnesium_polylepis.1